MKIETYKIWFTVGTCFLFLSVLAHSSGHYLFYIREETFDPERAALAQTMKSYIADKIVFDTSMWTLLKMFSMCFSLLFLFAALINLVILASDVTAELMQRVALLNSAFWFVSLVLFSLLTPAIQPIAICGVAAAIFGTSYVLSLG